MWGSVQNCCTEDVHFLHQLHYLRIPLELRHKPFTKSCYLSDSSKAWLFRKALLLHLKIWRLEPWNCLGIGSKYCYATQVSILNETNLIESFYTHIYFCYIITKTLLLILNSKKVLDLSQKPFQSWILKHSQTLTKWYYFHKINK